MENALVDEVAKTFNVSGVCFDISTEEGIELFWSRAIERLGAIEILINNAGSAITQPIESMGYKP